MSRTFSLTVSNNSGAMQQYVLLSGSSNVAGAPISQPNNVVYESARVPSGGMAEFEISNEFYAFTGMSPGSPRSGMEVRISSIKPVRLASGNQPGSAVTVSNGGGQLRLGSSDEQTATSGAFSLRTSGDFTIADARQDGWLIGAGIKSGNGQPVAFNAFVPEPNVNYQVQPNVDSILTVGNYRVGQLIDPRETHQAVKLPFSQRGDITVIHESNGTFRIQ